MLPANRKRHMVEVITEQSGCSVSELAAEFACSEGTIRRDLKELSEKGLINRTHGGAVPETIIGREQPFDQKEVQNLEGKAAIADRAVREIHEGQVVFFDSGTTTMEVAKKAPTDGSFVAMTNSPVIGLELAEESGVVHLTGGTVRHQTRALVGPGAERFIERRWFDLLFLGTHAIDSEAGLTSPNEQEARMKESMVDHAGLVVLVAEAAKIGKQSFVKYASLSDVDLFVTDRPLSDEHREMFIEADVEIAFPSA